MKVRMGFRLFFGLGSFLLGLYALYAAWSWPFKSALFPRTIGVPLLVLAIWMMIFDSAVGKEEEKGHAVDFELTTDVEPGLARRRTAAIFGWIAGFFFLIMLLGFPIAVPVLVFCYLKFAGKEGWMLTVSLTLVAWVFTVGLFDRLLHIRFAEGWIFTLLG